MKLKHRSNARSADKDTHFETHTALKHSPSLQDLRGCLEDRRNLGVQGDPV